VTGRATFGDLARAANRQLDSPGSARPGRADAGPGPVRAFISGLHDVVTVMARYCGDVTAVLERTPGRVRVLGPWLRASVRVQEAVQNAAAFTGDNRAGTSRAGPVGAAADGLAGAAASLAAGRDLLHTHFAIDGDRSRLERSEWAPVVTSLPVTLAMLLEVGLWSRKLASRGGRLALVQPGADEDRRILVNACQWLWMADSAVQAAQRARSVAAADVELLHAIPANMLPARYLPGGEEPVSGLCQGVTDSAERVRHAARLAAAEVAWSSALTVESFRQSAACGTVIGHNCEVVLRSLAARARQQCLVGLSEQLLGSAGAAAAARSAWLQAAQAWYRVTTDARGTLSAAADESADLALWTGRLAYANPQWSLALGPGHAPRAPENLAAGPGDIGQAVAAVHQACQTLAEIAAADFELARTAGRAGRLLAPTRSLPFRFSLPHPLAPTYRIGELLAAYQDAQVASTAARDAVAQAAEVMHAPSHVLTAARAAVRATAAAAAGRPLALRRQPQQASPRGALEPTRAAETGRGDTATAWHASPPPNTSVPGAAGHDRPEPGHRGGDPGELPGPVERVLHDLGVTSPEALQRAAAIDRAADELILEAAQAAGPRPASLEGAGLSRSAATAELVNRLLASGDPRAAALLPPSPRLAPPVPADPACTAAGPSSEDAQRVRSDVIGAAVDWPVADQDRDPG
jgi:hypothetical protein